MKGELILIPTPLYEEMMIEVKSKEFLLDKEAVIVVEEHKEGRRRWLKWGLPRDAIEKFVVFNEHTSKELIPTLIKEMKSGKKIMLMSDGGMPAFCDPGRDLIEACHRQNIKVSSAPFHNAPILALILSGFISETFIFHGFLPAKNVDREIFIKNCLKEKRTQIVMDTPYRLHSLLEEFQKEMGEKTSREISLSLDLFHPQEMIIRGKINDVRKRIELIKKAEFIFVLGPH